MSISFDLRYSAFFRLVTHANFKLSRVKFRNDLKGNKNYFELAGGSSHRGENYCKCIKGNPEEIEFWFELAGASSVNCTKRE